MNRGNGEQSPFAPKLNVSTFMPKNDFVYGHDTGTGTDITPDRF